MHHHSAPLHWGYSNAPTSQTSVHNTWVPPPSRGLKRSISESDCEDNYSETSSKEWVKIFSLHWFYFHYPFAMNWFILCLFNSTSPKDDADSCQHMSRKKRRGVIEKKRRDRINSSLSELKRLVPSAYEKQGSSKLEKAEILQLTVDHLKTLHSKGAYNFLFFSLFFLYLCQMWKNCQSEKMQKIIIAQKIFIQLTKVILIFKWQIDQKKNMFPIRNSGKSDSSFLHLPFGTSSHCNDCI